MNLYRERLKKRNIPRKDETRYLKQVNAGTSRKPRNYFQRRSCHQSNIRRYLRRLRDLRGPMPTIATRIVRDPRNQSRLFQELEEAKGMGYISDPPMYDQLVKLSFLTACISEGLRMHPITGISLPRTLPEGGVEISGQFIPAGVS
jgi:hypothetical protein